MKKHALTALLLAGMISCCTFSGCQSGGGQTGEKATIDIFQFKVEIHDSLKKAAETYMDSHPGIVINLETVGGGDDYGSALRTKMASSDQPEIYNIGGPQDVIDWSDHLEDLSGEEWISYVGEGLLDDVTKDGKVYGLPMAIEGYGFLYNKAIFEKAGIDGESLTTFDEINSAFETLKKKIDNGELKDDFPSLEAVIEYPVKETWVTGMHTANIEFGQEFGSAAEAYEAKEIPFAYSDELKQLIDMQIQYSSSASNPSALNAVDYSMQVGGGYAIERVAVIQQGNWVYPEIATVDKTVAENTGIIPIPLKGVSEGNIPVGVPMYWCVNSQSSDADKTAAKEFLQWLYQSDEGKEIVVNELGFIPAFTNYGDLTPSDPIGKKISEHVTDGTIAPWVWAGAPTGWAQETLGVNIQSYVSGQKTWDEVISESKKAWADARKS